MSNTTKARSLPRLRFPEFRGAEPWEQNTLKQITTQLLDGDWIESKDQSDSGYRLIQTGNIGVGEFVAKSGKARYVSEETFERLHCTEIFPGDCLISRLPDPAGRSCFIPDIGEKMITAVDCTIVRFDKAKIVPYLFIAHTQTDDYFLKVAALSSGSTRQRISRENLTGLWFSLPRSHAEQQKIADCLSSSDELIDAQTRKVGALKTHKKGLMQQLFPREGETQPRLRFPEFRDASEWERIPLGSLCARIMDGTHFSPKSKEGPRPYLTSKNIRDGRIDLSNLSYISETEHAEIYSKCPVKLHDVLLTKDGANTGNCTLNDLDFEFSLLSSVAVLRGEPSKLRQDFLFQSILSDTVQSLISESMSGQAITRITLAKIGGFAIPVTSLSEQQRIADCLTFLDTLITTATQELETLKTHKKGLMQQLFPSAEAVEV